MPSTKEDCKFCSNAEDRMETVKMGAPPGANRCRCRFDCIYCVKSLKMETEGGLQEHCFVQKQTCTYCPEEFQGCANLQTHIKERHNDDWLKIYGALVNPRELEVDPEGDELDIEALRAEYAAGEIAKEIPEKLLDHLMLKVCKEGTFVVGCGFVKRFLKFPTRKQEIVIPPDAKHIVLPCKIHIDVYSVIIVNITEQSIHFYNPKYKLIADTCYLVSRIVAGLYSSLKIEFLVGGSKLLEYNLKVQGPVTASSGLRILFFCYNVGREKQVALNQASLEELKQKYVLL